jgi:hypothetical protein
LDLRPKSNSEIEAFPVTASSRAFLLVLRNGKDPGIVDMFDEWKPLLGEAGREPSGLQVMQLLVNYLGLVAPNMTRQAMTHLGRTAGLEPAWIRKSFAFQQLQEGIAMGREQGLAEGAEKQTRHLLLMQSNVRFGPLPVRVLNLVNNATLSELEAWLFRFALATKLEDVFG